MSLLGSNRADESFDGDSRSREDEGRDAPDANSAAEAEDSCAITSRICDLQKALNYLISRDEKPGDETNDNSRATNKNQDGAANAIPNLINNILKEHYGTEKEKASSNTSSEHGTSVAYVDQKVLMTQLLIAVIIEFAEPHFVKTSQLNRAVDDQRPSKKTKTSPSDAKSKNIDSDDGTKFSKRAVEWATSCISRLLQTPTSSDDPTHIAELDALLGATGENDGLKLEDLMQKSLLCGLMGAKGRTT